MWVNYTGYAGQRGTKAVGTWKKVQKKLVVIALSRAQFSKSPKFCKSHPNFAPSVIYALKTFEGVYIHVKSAITFFDLEKLDENMTGCNIYQNP